MLKENFSLKNYNSFGLDVKARYFAEVTSVQELKELIKSPIFKSQKHLVLGGGSNVLFTQDFDGLLIKISIKNISIVKETSEYAYLKAMAGDVWHEVVLYSLEKGLGGLENLSLIPGQIGAAPMQNIGAYGIELKSVFESLEALEIATGEIKTFTKETCGFGYRESVFKNILKGKFIILSVLLKLRKTQEEVHVEYGAIQQVLTEKGIKKPNAKAVSEAVIEIRQSKLPNPKVLGNAGSFFKNPVLEKTQFEALLKAQPNMPNYDLGNGTFKVPAGWLIEQCGWKGKVVGNVGAHKNQALVLVNYGSASGKELLHLAEKIQESVFEKFGVKISPEVNII